MKTIKIATRGSPLALWQSHHVRELLLLKNPHLKIELVTIITSGDKFLGRLSSIGGKGLFVKEIEECLLAQKADLAVHSMKDLPYAEPEGLEIASILEREDPSDTLVTLQGKKPSDLPIGALVGTSSVRRRAQLLATRPDLICKDIRGNVGTRLSKLKGNEFSALILATAGLKRLGLMKQEYFQFSKRIMLPAAGQGAIGIQVRSDSEDIRNLVSDLACSQTTASVRAERKMVQVLGGDCGSPIAGFAALSGNNLELNGMVSDLKGVKVLRTVCSGDITAPDELGERVAKVLMKGGASSILKTVSY